MRCTISMDKIVHVYTDYILETYEPIRAERNLNEFTTSLFRYTLIGLGFERLDPKAKMTASERQEAEAFLQTLDLTCLPKLMAAFEQGADRLQVGKSPRSTFGGRIRHFVDWALKKYAYMDSAVYNRRHENECRPKMRHGRGDWKAFSLMEDKEKQLKYRIEEEDISPDLRAQLDAFSAFMQDIDDPNRPFDEVEESTAFGYLKGTGLWLGWILYYDDPAKSGTLRLEDLIPKILEKDLDNLTAKERKALWAKAQRELECRITRYFEFLRTQQKADSPRTRVLKLTTLLMLTKFLYAPDVEDKDDYKDIPIIRTIQKRLEKEQKSVEAWEKSRSYVADQSRKWLEPADGQTVLEYAQETLIEILRLESRIRHSTGDFCKGHIIAKGLLIYLMHVDVGVFPPGRQQEPKSYLIALSCPVERPDTVPIDGLYWPLPPDWAREKCRRDGSLNDNYYYKVYHHDGKFYENGVWVRERCKYKTRRHHGKRVSVIDNIMFEDGTCLYGHIERYLCGQWYAGNFRTPSRYDWWDETLRGTYGKWLSQGRAELCSGDTPVFVREGKSSIWVTSYLFVNPTDGKQFKDTQISDLFARNSYRITGKRITPHTFRYMWATWAFQMGLSDAELKSLAHEMGLTVKTLHDMYQRCSPTEKNRPINKAMRKLFPRTIAQDSPQDKGDRLVSLKEHLSSLNPEELQELRRLLGEDLAL